MDIGLPAAPLSLAWWILQSAVVPHRHHATGVLTFCFVDFLPPFVRFLYLCLTAFIDLSVIIFTLHRMNEIQRLLLPMIAPSVSLSDAQFRCTKTAERIEVLFVMKTLGAQETLC